MHIGAQRVKEIYSLLPRTFLKETRAQKKSLIQNMRIKPLDTQHEWNLSKSLTNRK